MKIAALTKFKVGELYKALRELNWTQSELARRSGIPASDIGRILNLRTKPSENRANKIQRAFADAGYYLDVLAIWPEGFKAFRHSPKIIQIKDVEPLQLEAMRQHEINLLEDSRPPVPGELHEAVDRTQIVEKLIETKLTEREQIIVRAFLDDETLESIGCKVGLTRQGANLALSRIIWKLAHGYRDVACLIDRETKAAIESAKRDGRILSYNTITGHSPQFENMMTRMQKIIDDLDDEIQASDQQRIDQIMREIYAEDKRTETRRRNRMQRAKEKQIAAMKEKE